MIKKTWWVPILCMVLSILLPRMIGAMLTQTLVCSILLGCVLWICYPPAQQRLGFSVLKLLLFFFSLFALQLVQMGIIHPLLSFINIGPFIEFMFSQLIELSLWSFVIFLSIKTWNKGESYITPQKEQPVLFMFVISACVLAALDYFCYVYVYRIDLSGGDSVFSMLNMLSGNSMTFYSMALLFISKIISIVCLYWILLVLMPLPKPMESIPEQ